MKSFFKAIAIIMIIITVAFLIYQICPNVTELKEDAIQKEDMFESIDYWKVSDTTAQSIMIDKETGVNYIMTILIINGEVSHSVCPRYDAEGNVIVNK